MMREQNVQPHDMTMKEAAQLGLVVLGLIVTMWAVAFGWVM